MEQIISLVHGLGGTEYAHVFARVSLGVFFAISGFDKLRDPTNLLATFRADHIPFVAVNRWFVPAVEFSAGIALTIGMLTPLAALGLLCICLVATCTDGVKRFHDSNIADWLDDLLYLPEVLYGLVLLYMIAAGSGPLAIDNLI